MKQAVLALLVSQDGGVPFLRKRWDGNTADSEVFQERAQALIAAFTNAPNPRYLIAASQLYHEENAPHLQKLGFLTRSPNTIGALSQVIAPALTWDPWHRLDAQTRYQSLERLV